MTTILLVKTLKTLKSFNRLIQFQNIYYNSKQSISYLLTKLNDRKLIEVQGNDSYDYIQGLVTNDMRHLSSTLETSVTHDCIHSFILNTSGRVVSDVFIYKYDYQKNTKKLLIEVDSQLVESIAKFLRSYRIRRKVEIGINKDLEVWSLFPSVAQLDEQTINELSESDTTFESVNSEDLSAVRDPRLKELGFRLLVNNKQNSNENEMKDKIQTFLKSNSIELSAETNADNYHKYRYRLGVGEGVKDFPIESCFPLECNGDFLNGISFHKGCYVGQELTARIYHTGVIRKRLMPIEIIGTDEVIENISVQNITTTDGKNVGKFRSNSGAYGLALLRIDDCLKATDPLVLSESKNLKIKCFKPFWWPKEYTKESVAPCGRTDH